MSEKSHQSSRQQPDQAAQSGSPALDQRGASEKRANGRRRGRASSRGVSDATNPAGRETAPKRAPGHDTDAVQYRDRPADDGKHGDADDAPNPGFPG
jgi:hypothetical protein